jgi:hypothetical protein
MGQIIAVRIEKPICVTGIVREVGAGDLLEIEL